jgi:hypothetical protein
MDVPDSRIASALLSPNAFAAGTTRSWSVSRVASVATRRTSRRVRQPVRHEAYSRRMHRERLRHLRIPSHLQLIRTSEDVQVMTRHEATAIDSSHLSKQVLFVRFIELITLVIENQQLGTRPHRQFAKLA